MRQRQRLTAKAVEQLRRSGYFGDGDGLYLQVTATRAKSWVFRYTLAGRSREMGLGSASAVTLAEARGKAQAARKLLAEKIDPIEARAARRASEAVEKARAITFGECAAKYIDAHRAGWKNEKHAAQWANTLETYAGPIIGSLPVADVDTALVLKVLEPIWTDKPETASRLRARIENVLDWATVRGYRRPGDNPARWRGHLQKLLPQLKKRQRVKHHAALPYDDIGEFMEILRTQEGTAARALEFTILTASRTSEVIGARSAEFDLNRAIWTIPKERMKAGREHRVPLSPRAAELVKAHLANGGEFLFPGAKAGRPLSNAAMLALLERMDRSDLTVHGFRSTFRDWTAERTAYPREVCEAALAHTVGDATEAAYRRGDVFAKRARLMAEWEKFCSTRSKGDVVRLKKGAA